MAFHRALLLVLAGFAAVACTVVHRNNPVDPGAESNAYRPHFAKTLEIHGMTNVLSVWGGSNAFYLLGYEPVKGAWLARVGWDGAIERETNHFASLPGSWPESQLRGIDTPSGDTLYLATNNALVVFDANLAIVSNLVPVADGTPIAEFAGLHDRGGTARFVTRGAPPYLVSIGSWTLSALPSSNLFSAGLGVQRGPGPASDAAALLVVYTTPSLSTERLRVWRVNPTNGLTLALSSGWLTEGTNGGNAYSGLAFLGNHGGDVYFMTRSTHRHLMRHRPPDALEWVLLDPEPQINLKAGFITEQGRLILAGSDRIVIYSATGN